MKILNKYASKWIVLCIDLILVGLSFVFAYFIRFNASFDFDHSNLIKQIPVVLIVGLFSFLVVGSYKGIVRHTGTRDAFNVFAGTLLISGITLILVSVNRVFEIYELFTIPISIIIIHYLVNTFILIISRFVFKAFYEIISTDLNDIKNVMIFGAGDSGLITYGALNKDTKENFEVIGFIDDDENKIGKKIDRVRVYDLKSITHKFLKKYDLDEVIISIQNLKASKLLEITDFFIDLDVEVKIVPPLSRWIGGALEASQIKQVKIEDLLNRNTIQINNPIVEREVKGKTILVTGAAGSIGSEISRQISNYKYEKLILIDQSESSLYEIQQELKSKNLRDTIVIVADIRDLKSMERIFEKHKPQKVFHAAAYKHVPLMENNPYEAIKTNIAGTKIIADLSLKYTVDRFVMISTDKAVNPTNIMGATKRIAELYISCLNKHSEKTKFTTTRFGNVLGSNGSVIPLFKKQILKGGPLTLTHKDITRYFMTIPEACSLVLEAGTMGEGGEIYIFDMGKAIKIYDIAKKMIQLSGLRYPQDIDIKITGLRPGEKLYEELLATGENTKSTYHEKIMIANVKQIDCSFIKSNIEKLCYQNRCDNNHETVILMKEIVPEFISNNSIYEKLDNKVSLD
ncbi:nucleoside-diphosphate sugar epimerase/dehydratase [Pseudotenacibaculum sp. MALMAid0570]|uniref:polysaccharide biosynthesis protein n=1 Tax=Pseudotenacibaculum sp. MALMAid0570 TaxID=3143938 RepID=UPI0032DFAAD9